MFSLWCTTWQARSKIPLAQQATSNNAASCYLLFPRNPLGFDPESRKDTIEYNRIADLRFYWKIRRHLFAGFATRYNKISNVDAGPHENFYEEPLGHEGYWLLGIALS